MSWFRLSRTILALAAVGSSVSGLTVKAQLAEPPTAVPGGVIEYRDLKPAIDTVESIRLLSTDKARQLEAEVRALYAAVAPTVVRIWGTANDGRAFDDRGFPIGRGGCSGVIIDRSGLVLTCGHLSWAPGTPLVFELHDGRRVRGVKLGRFAVEPDSEYDQPDIGLARIEEQGEWPAAQVADELPEQGSICLCVGYPGVLPPSSPPLLRIGRILPHLPGYAWLRSTTAYSPGDSGGPLFDMQGRVHGVVNGGEEISYTQYEPVHSLAKYRARLEAGEVVSAPRQRVRVLKALTRDHAAFAPALDLEGVVVPATRGVIRILDGIDEIATGLLIDDAGHAVAKRSLLIDRSELRCRFSYTESGEMVCPVTVVGGSAEHDLALLKIDGAPAASAVDWSPEDPSVGQLVATFADGRHWSITQFCVVGAAVRAVAPPLGDVAQLPFHFEPNADGALVVTAPPFRSGETDGLPPAIVEGDVVTHLAGVPTPNLAEFGRVLMPLLYAALPDGGAFDSSVPAPGNYAGEPLAVTVRRGGQSLDLSVIRVHSGMQSPFTWSVNPRNVRRDGFPAAFSIDARIRPDQCGGPVVDLSGRVVGLTIARANSTQTLVLPARTVRQVVDEVLAGRNR